METAPFGAVKEDGSLRGIAHVSIGRNGDRSFRSGEVGRFAGTDWARQAAMETAPFGAVKLSRRCLSRTPISCRNGDRSFRSGEA